jgi:hypothetical protein
MIPENISMFDQFLEKKYNRNMKESSMRTCTYLFDNIFEGLDHDGKPKTNDG